MVMRFIDLLHAVRLPAGAVVDLTITLLPENKHHARGGARAACVPTMCGARGWTSNGKSEAARHAAGENAIARTRRSPYTVDGPHPCMGQAELQGHNGAGLTGNRASEFVPSELAEQITADVAAPATGGIRTSASPGNSALSATA
jgi:hypothetical protein